MTRHRGEGITIELPTGEYISINILELGTKQVRLGFNAHKNIIIHRDEVWERINKEQIEKEDN